MNLQSAINKKKNVSQMSLVYTVKIGQNSEISLKIIVEM